MISKIAPLVVMGMAAQSYYNKTKKGKKEMAHAKKKNEKSRSLAMEKAVAKKKRSKSKCPKCGGKGCSHCKGKGYHK